MGSQGLPGDTGEDEGHGDSLICNDPPQDHIYRECWTDSLSSCVGGAAGWGRLLAGVEQFRARHRGQVSYEG